MWILSRYGTIKIHVCHSLVMRTMTVVDSYPLHEFYATQFNGPRYYCIVYTHIDPRHYSQFIHYLQNTVICDRHHISTENYIICSRTNFTQPLTEITPTITYTVTAIVAISSVEPPSRYQFRAKHALCVVLPIILTIVSDLSRELLLVRHSYDTFYGHLPLRFSYSDSISRESTTPVTQVALPSTRSCSPDVGISTD